MSKKANKILLPYHLDRISNAIHHANTMKQTKYSEESKHQSRGPLRSKDSERSILDRDNRSKNRVK